jgi:hypothetical protein
VAFTSYGELQTAILKWLNRAGDTEAASACPDWIALAEDEMRMGMGRLHVRQGETVNEAFAITSAYTDLPSGFFGLRAIVIAGVSPRVLEYMAPGTADTWPSLDTAGEPRYYTIQGNKIRVFPAPDGAYTANLTYYALPSLTGSNPTNWLLAAHPKLYLYASLAEAAAFFEDAEKAALYEAKREQLLNAIAASDSAFGFGSSMQIRVAGGAP